MLGTTFSIFLESRQCILKESYPGESRKQRSDVLAHALLQKIIPNLRWNVFPNPPLK